MQLENPDERHTFRYLTLGRGIRYENEWVEWCNEVLATLASSLPLDRSNSCRAQATDQK